MTFDLFLDTNVLLDYIVRNRPGHDAAVRLFALSASGDVALHVSPLSLKDVYYIGSKRFGKDAMTAIIQGLTETCEVEDCTAADCRTAACSDEPDFEDGLIRATAERCGVDFLISRDNAAFLKSPLKAMDAERFLGLFF